MPCTRGSPSTALERFHADRLGEHVDLLAHHAARAETREKAVRYSHLAGVKAVERSANQEAVGHLEQALALLEQLPETKESLTVAVDTCIALGSALVALIGASAPKVEAVYVRARALVDRLDDESRRFLVLWGLWFVDYSRGRYREAGETGEQLLVAAGDGSDTERLLQAHHSLWATQMAIGRSQAAMVHTERGRPLYQRERHASRAFMYGGHDPGACCRYQEALNRWLLGQPDRAVAVLDEALVLIDELRHPLTTAIVLWCEVWLHHHRGEREATIATGERLLALTAEHGFARWVDAAIVALPVARGVRLGADALAELHQQLVAVRSANWRHVFCVCVLTGLYADAGLAEDGLRALASLDENDRGAFYAREVFRMEGELLLEQSPSASAAEPRFRHALALARERGEKSLELRAAMSLARLLAGRAQRMEARAVLAPVYDWFTEGLETADLVAAKALLAQLG